jgi:hypothetical protein
MDYKIYDMLLKEYQERMAMLSLPLTQGACLSFEEYKYICGQLRGLEAACFIITDLKQQLEKADD